MTLLTQNFNQSEIRKQKLDVLRLLTAERKNHSSDQIIKQILHSEVLDHLTDYAALGIFSSLNTEPGLEKLPTRMQQTNPHRFWSFCYPKVHEEEGLNFYQTQRLQSCSLGVLEPDIHDHKTVLAKYLDLIFVPGVAFHRSGLRIGRGKGYYDRYLKNKNVLKIGVCFHESLCSEVWDVQVHDQKMDWIITDQEVIRCCDQFKKL